MGIRGKRRVINSLALAGVLAALGGCGGQKTAEPSDNTPWNNGPYAIMETEKGYYSNLIGWQSIRFYEKDTDTEIYLCGKPECPHDGRESCAATYRDLQTVNSVLYEGMIYILAVDSDEESARYTMYRAALDGTTIDRIGDAVSVDFVAENDRQLYFLPSGLKNVGSAFIIHRGCAYIPFYFELSDSYSSETLAGGIMKMDLETGQTEQIYDMKMPVGGPYPVELIGCGDHIYFFCEKNMSRRWYYRYDTRDGSLVNLRRDIFKEDIPEAFTERKIYVTQKDDMYQKLHVYDSETLEDTGTVFELEKGADRIYLGPVPSFKVMPYEDKLFLYYADELMIYSETGEKLGGISAEFPGFAVETPIYYAIESDLYYQISQGKVYAVLLYNMDFHWDDPEYIELIRDKAGEVYACPIQDILDGRGEWSHVYTMKSQYGLTGEERQRDYKGPRRGGRRVIGYGGTGN